MALRIAVARDRKPEICNKCLISKQNRVHTSKPRSYMYRLAVGFWINTIFSRLPLFQAAQSEPIGSYLPVIMVELPYECFFVRRDVQIDTLCLFSYLCHSMDVLCLLLNRSETCKSCFVALYGNNINSIGV